jgi:hypothetical protein
VSIDITISLTDAEIVKVLKEEFILSEADVPRLLQDQEFKERLTSLLKDCFVDNYYMDDGELENALGYCLNRLGIQAYEGEDDEDDDEDWEDDAEDDYDDYDSNLDNLE